MFFIKRINLKENIEYIYIYMFYRTLDGKLVEITRSMFTNDSAYYKKILHTTANITKVTNIKTRIVNIIN